jgi:hypothetical protein
MARMTKLLLMAMLRKIFIDPPLLSPRIVKILRLNLLIAFVFQRVLHNKLASPSEWAKNSVQTALKESALLSSSSSIARFIIWICYD